MVYLPSLVGSITYKSLEVKLQLYNILVRSHLDNCTHLWSLYYRKDGDSLEMEQKRFTGMLPELEGISCKEWLVKCGLFSLLYDLPTCGMEWGETHVFIHCHIDLLTDGKKIVRQDQTVPGLW